MKVDSEKVRTVLLSMMGMWHHCALPRTERGIQKGTLCDECLEFVGYQMKDLEGGDD